MIKFATVFGIAALAASSALADDGYNGHNCGSYSSAKASVPSVDLANGYTLPATTTTVENVEVAPITIESEPVYEAAQVVPTDAYAAADIVILPAQ